MNDARDQLADTVRAMIDGDLNRAIPALQNAKANPTLCIACLNLLAQCYLDKKWYDEAIDAWSEAVNDYPHHDDALGIELRARLAQALDEQQTAKKRSP